MKKAFTITELLVVILIIAILLSLLFPALSKVRYLTKSKACHNNLRQLALAVQMYSSDYKDLPDAYPTESLVPDINLSAKLASYLDSPRPKIGHRINPWTCPHDSSFYVSSGGSYYYNPFTLRRNYTLPLVAIFENIPLLAMMQDVVPRRNGMTDIVRYDGSALEVNQSTYRPGATWLTQYRRPL